LSIEDRAFPIGYCLRGFFQWQMKNARSSILNAPADSRVVLAELVTNSIRHA